jgi:phosphate starvation-inducible membrane PsiE
VADLKVARPTTRERSTAEETRLRAWVARGFGRVEDVVYVGLGLLLAATAVALLGHAVFELGAALLEGRLPGLAVELLDRILLILLVVEILYTVQVSFREHALVPEPFLLVALIAAVRRMLVITAEFSAQEGIDEKLFRHVMWELALLTVLVIVLVASLVVLRRKRAEDMPRSHHG